MSAPTTVSARALVRSAVFGMIAAAMMVMFAMIASVTYQHHGFFTPLFHISALTGSPASMMTSVMKAQAGSRFWFTPGAALAGLVIHMVTGAMYGIVFGLVAPRLKRSTLIPAGMAYGIVVYLVSAYIGLPIAASISGAGSVISDMASMVGTATFVVEHVIFGMTLGVLAYFATPAESPATATTTTDAQLVRR